MDIYKNYYSLLQQIVSIKSVSTDKSYQSDINKQVNWLKNYMTKIGFKVKVVKGYGNPIIVATLTTKGASKTVLHYGHYDVQPAQDEGWKSAPYSATQVKNKVYGRGVVDNKGQFLIYLATIENLVKTGKLKYNVKFVIEGDEETGSGDLEKFFKDHAKLLKCDFAIVSDGEQVNKQPTIDMSYRGSINAKLTLKGPKNELHSGLYGGIVLNPINELCNLVNKINGRTLTKNLKILKVSKRHLDNLKANEFDFTDFKKITGLDNPMFSNAYAIYKTLGFSTAVEITGIKGGFIEQGFKNAIPTHAEAKINIRFPGFYKVETMVESLEKLVRENVPEYVKFELQIKDKANGVVLDVNNKYFEDVKATLEKVYNKKVLFNYCGATLPVAGILKHNLKVPCVFVGLANLDSNMHGVNENFDIDLIKKGLKFAESILS